MKKFLEHLIELMIVLCWITGIVVASGFWSTFFAIFFFPWAWYLTVEQILIHYTPFLG